MHSASQPDISRAKQKKIASRLNLPPFSAPQQTRTPAKKLNQNPKKPPGHTGVEIIPIGHNNAMMAIRPTTNWCAMVLSKRPLAESAMRNIKGKGNIKLDFDTECPIYDIKMRDGQVLLNI